MTYWKHFLNCKKNRNCLVLARTKLILFLVAETCCVLVLIWIVMLKTHWWFSCYNLSQAVFSFHALILRWCTNSCKGAWAGQGNWQRYIPCIRVLFPVYKHRRVWEEPITAGGGAGHCLVVSSDILYITWGFLYLFLSFFDMCISIFFDMCLHDSACDSVCKNNGFTISTWIWFFYSHVSLDFSF